jgi:hypothetical protein
MSTDFVAQENGEPDMVAPQAEQHALENLPVEVLVYLLGSRRCETDRLSDVAWSLFGQVLKGWTLVQAICDFVHDPSGTTEAIPSSTPMKRSLDPAARGIVRSWKERYMSVTQDRLKPNRSGANGPEGPSQFAP